MATTTCQSLVGRVTGDIKQAAVLLDEHSERVKQRLGELTEQELSNPSITQSVFTSLNVTFDALVVNSTISICTFAAVYDALLREGLGENYRFIDVNAFLQARNRLIADRFGAHYQASETEMRILELVKTYYALHTTENQAA